MGFEAPFAFSFVIFSSEFYGLVFCRKAFLSCVVITDFQSALFFFLFICYYMAQAWENVCESDKFITSCPRHTQNLSGHSMFFFLFVFILLFFCIITVMEIFLLNLTFHLFL